MRVFVTGSTGFIGKYVCKQLSSDGITVVGLCRKKENSVDVIVDEVVEGDISLDSFADIITASVDRCDAIIHLAANVVVPDYADTIPTNIYGTKNVLELASKWSVKRLIYLSSIPVIGVPIETPVTESHKVFPRTLYHMSKYIGEKMIEESNLSSISAILRISSPVGVGMSNHNFLSIIINKLINNNEVEIYGKGERIQNYIDVRDIAELIGNCVTNTVSGLFLVGGKNSYSNKEVVKICKSAIGSSSKVLCGLHTDPEEDNKWIISLKKAISELDYNPKFDLLDSIEWIVENVKT